MEKVLVISDNHGMKDEMIRVIAHESADLVIHAGDYGMPINSMKQYFDYFVDGNNDYAWRQMQTFTFANIKFVLVHGDSYWAWDQNKWYQRLKDLGKENDADIVVFGHSHREYIDTKEKPYLINPGSISLPRNDKMLKSYALILIDNNKITIQIKYLEK